MTNGFKSQAQQAPATHALAIVSLILSILRLVGVLPLVGSIGGIISGHIARQERSRPSRNCTAVRVWPAPVSSWAGSVW